MLIQQISIFVENKKGRLAEITKVIGDAGIDIRALSVADTTDFGILRLIVDKPDDAVQKLKNAGMTVSLTDVIAVSLDDKPGAFSHVVQLLSDNDINIEYMYAFIGRDPDKAYVILRVEDPSHGIDVLGKNDIKLLGSAEVYGM
ncbi:ACT domain-containing protein [Ruminococcaceae bacterium OttesenSCG-928-L11]|nr:ACT domain-containing protein [Ruminococcaceae bacterium OttesenSCG-928-L11]